MFLIACDRAMNGLALRKCREEGGEAAAKS